MKHRVSNVSTVLALVLFLWASVTVRHSKSAVIRRHADDSGPMFIVGWNPKLSAEDIEVRTQQVTSQVFGVRGVTEELKPIDINIGDFKAMCSYLTPEAREELEKNQDVMWVQERTEVRAYETRQVDQSLYNLDILDGAMDGQITLPDNAGSGVDVYVIDSGLFAEHSDFGGRAKAGKNFAGGNGRDGNGHGTHVAGTIGGSTFGVAKGANLVGVRVLGDNGGGSNVAVLRGIQFAVQSAKSSGRPCVINMSLGSKGQDRALESAVREATSAGCVVVAAAGNDGTDACNDTPGREPSAITVAASDAKNNIARFSNVGKCVDVVAPGVRIVSASNQNPQGKKVLDGTSMAAPLVAGVAAVMLSQGIQPSEIAKTITGQATANAVKGNLRGTPNILVSLAGLNGGSGNSTQPPPAPDGGDGNANPPAEGGNLPGNGNENQPGTGDVIQPGNGGTAQPGNGVVTTPPRNGGITQPGNGVTAPPRNSTTRPGNGGTAPPRNRIGQPGNGGTVPPRNGTFAPPRNGTAQPGTNPPRTGGATPPRNGTAQPGTNPPRTGGATPPRNGTTTRPGNGGPNTPRNGTVTRPGNGGAIQPGNGTRAGNGGATPPRNAGAIPPRNGGAAQPGNQGGNRSPANSPAKTAPRKQSVRQEKVPQDNRAATRIILDGGRIISVIQ